jgi:ABC-type uncharacterized transport system permease subunit
MRHGNVTWDDRPFFLPLVDKSGRRQVRAIGPEMSHKQERAITSHKIKQLIFRILRIAKFDTKTIQDLKEDKTATGQAIAVLLLVGLTYGFGYSALTGLQTHSLSANQLISGTIANMIFTDFAAFIWSATVFLVGTKLFQGRTSYWQLARPLFFSTAPGVIFILIAIPFSPIIFTAAVIASAWIVLGEFVALKNAMGFNSQRAILTSVVGLLILAFIEMTI